MSGGKIGFFDPQEKYFKEGGQGCTFSASELYRDQFDPYNVFGCSMTASSYDATLFRFPLRNDGDESDLSKSVHSPETIRTTLFESFKQDAHLVPLFLNSVSSIKLFEWRPGSESPVKVFSVCIDKETRQAVRHARERINVRVEKGEVLVEEAVVTCRDIEAQILTRQRWLISHYISKEMSVLLKLSEEIHQLPRIGLALSLPPLTAQAEDPGRVFCFLPLPPTGESNTGLPVHVHGSFSVADDRGSLKWGASDCQTKEVEWNSLLLEHLMAPAYDALIHKAISLSLDHGTVYRAWPDPSDVKHHWKGVVDRFLRRLLCGDVFWTESEGSWISLSKAVVSESSELNPDDRVAYEEMIGIGVPVVLPPKNVLACLKAACYQPFDSKFVRALLRNRFCGLAELSRERKLSLLAFVLKDEDYADLVGLFLLPVNDDSFVEFYMSTSPQKVFIGNDNIPLSLFPGMDNIFLHCALREDLFSKLTSHQCRSALSLVKLKHRHVSSLLKQILTSYWPLQEEKSTLPWSDQPSRQWMQDVWEWIGAHNKYDEFVGYFVVPCDNFTSVAKLVRGRNVIFAEHDSALPMSRNVASTFRSAGCVVLQDCPDYISISSNYELTKYVWTQDKVLHCIAQVPLSVSSFHNWSAIQCQEVLSFLSRVIRNVSLTSAMESALLSMPLFRLYNSPAYSSLQKCRESVPESVKNLSLMRPLLSFPNHEESTVLRNLSSFHRQLTFEELFTEVVFPDMETSGMDYTTSVVKYLLDNLDNHHPLPDVVRKHINELPFIPVADGTIKKPSELFEPSSPLLSKLFRDKAVFPEGPFALSKKYGRLLSGIVCFRPLESISGSEIVEIAHEASAGDAEKGEALLSLFVCEDRFLWVEKRLSESFFSAFGSTVADLLKEIKWCPVEDSAPCSYPSTLPWKSDCCKTALPSETVCALACSELSLEELSFLVGSTEFILKGGIVQNESLLEFLGLCQVTLDSVLKHWLKAMEKYKSDKESFGVQFGKMMATLLSLLPQYLSQASLEDAITRQFSDPNFIWISDDVGFVSANRLAVSCIDIRSLKPWLFTIRQGGYSHLSSAKIQSALGIKSDFSQSVLLNALTEMKISHDEGKALAADVGRDLTVAVRILDWFAKNVDEVSPTILGKMLVPVNHPCNLRLLSCADVIYFDTECTNSDLTDCDVLHGSITRETALKLGVPFLSSRRALSEYKDIKSCLDDHAVEFGEEFGQQEPLARRLRNIIGAYPWGVQILKELVQNADDAGASTLHIVYDKRNHPARTVFGDGWKHLQGPALLVYNDRPFSEDDLSGIQNLGLGSKRDDAAKIGQFGIGFNAVYHLTDCPSFISDNKVFCVLDPLCKFIPGSSINKPGRKFYLKEGFWEKISDVKDAYYSVFSADELSGATLFRFPLRHTGYSPAEPIRKKGVSCDEMNILLEDFADISSKLLLFLNSLKTIKLSIVDDEERTEEFSVCAELDSTATLKRRELFKKIAAAKEVETFRIPWFQVEYEMTIIEDKKGYISSQCCLVLQSIGYQSLCDGDIRDFSEEAVLPRAGVAASVFAIEIKYDCKAYCFLPLPGKIPLPVYVNGHFALDSSRRDLFRDSSSARTCNLKQAWNEHLIDYCVVPAYAAFLEEAKRYVIPERKGDSDFCSRLAWFHSLFPVIKDDNNSYWNRLSCKVYECLTKSSSPVLAYVDCLLSFEQQLLSDLASYSGKKLYSQFRSQDRAAVDAASIIITSFSMKPSLRWYSIGPVERQGVHFSRALYWSQEAVQLRLGTSGAIVLKALLLLLGLPVVTTTQRIFSSLQSVGDSGVEMTTPESVCSFLYHFEWSLSPRKFTLGEIKTTLFKSPVVVGFLLNFLFVSQEGESLSLKKLEGLPLLVTGDERLRVFSKNYPVYLSRFPELLPTNRDLFVHPHIRDSTFSHFRYIEIAKTTPTIRLLSPSAFVALLQRTKWLPLKAFAWYTIDEEPPFLSNWVAQFWEYIMTEGLACSTFENALDFFSDYPLIPTTSHSHSVFVPISLGFTVLHVTDFHIPAEKAVMEMGMPVLQIKLVGERAAAALVKSRLVTFGFPGRVIKALQHLSSNKMCFCCDASVSLCLLKYFNSHVDRRSRQPTGFTSDDLGALPLFETVDGSFRPLFSGKSVCLPESLLLCGKEVWMESVPLLFLKRQPELYALYECLDVNTKSLADIYLELILPKFRRMSNDDRMEHLLFLKSFSELPKVLKKLALTPCFFADGDVYCVERFYNPDVQLFTLTLPSEVFPPMPTTAARLLEEDRVSWLEFLQKLGLQKVASAELLIQLGEHLEEISRELKTLPDIWITMSKLLFHHFIENDYSSSVRDRFLSLKCLPAATIRNDLAAISKPFPAVITSCKLSVKYSAVNEWLCWTSRSLAPKWTESLREKSAVSSPIIIKRSPSLLQVIKNVKCYVVGYEAAKCRGKVDENLLKEMQRITLCAMQFFGRNLKFRPPPVLPVSSNLRNFLIFESCFQDAASIDVARKLRELDFIFVKEAKTLVKPLKVVWRSPKEMLHLYPYFYELPAVYGEYIDLLRCLGVDAEARPFHCARVLEDIRDRNGKSNSALKDESDLRKAKSAIQCLFSLLECNQGKKSSKSDKSLIEALKPLFLLNRNDGLELSSDLFFLDNIQHETYIQTLEIFNSFSFLIDITKCNLSNLHECTVDLLPECLRPKIASNFFCSRIKKGSMVDSSSEKHLTATKRLQTLVNSQHFVSGLKSMYVDKSRSDKIPSHFEVGLKTLTHVRFVCLHSFSTCLVLLADKKEVDKTAENADVYLEVSKEAVLYLSEKALNDNSSGAAFTVWIKVANFVMQLLRHPTYIDSAIVAGMLTQSSPSEIPSYLKDFGISFREFGDVRKLQKESCNVEVVCGREVNPAQMNHIFNDGNFAVGEWAVCKIAKNKPIYGQVLSKLYTLDDLNEDDDHSRFIIDIGQEDPAVVDSSNLYKFMKRATDLPRDVAPAIESRPVHRASMTFQEKHADLSPLSNEVSQFKICKLGLQSERVCESFHYNFSHSSHSLSGEMRYSSRGASRHVDSEVDDVPCFSIQTCSPQPRIGRMFRSQAEADLFAARDQYEVQLRKGQCNFALVCFLCHECAEKALKGVLLLKRGLDFRLSKSHNIRIFLSALDYVSESAKFSVQSSILHLSSYYVPTRYPDALDAVPAVSFTQDEARNALESAETIVKEIKV